MAEERDGGFLYLHFLIRARAYFDEKNVIDYCAAVSFAIFKLTDPPAKSHGLHGFERSTLYFRIFSTYL